MRRRRLSRLRAALTMTVGLLLLTGGPAQATDNRGTPETPETHRALDRGRLVAWHGARLTEPGSRKLIVQFWGSPARCVGGYYVGAVPPDDGDDMVVYVRTGPVPTEPVACLDVIEHHTRIVELPADLRGDTAIDSATGETKPVFDVTAVHMPEYLPEGYGFKSNRINGTFDVFRWSNDQTNLVVAIKDRDPTASYRPRPDDELIRRTTINGSPATVWRIGTSGTKLLVGWIEDNHTVDDDTITVTTSGPDKLPVDELLRVARSLAPCT